jgi:hypothetical protein
MSGQRVPRTIVGMTEDNLTEPAARGAQITLPGQAATVDGPLDMTMMYVMHHAFRRDLRALTAAAAATPLSSRSTWRALARRWDLFAYVLHHHHTGEDNGYWPLLAKRVDSSDLWTLEGMEAEHAAIDPLLAECGAGFARLAHRTARIASERDRVTLVETLRQAVDHLDVHLAHEVTEAIPLLHRYTTPAEDERIEAEHFRAGLPLSKIAEIVPWALHELPDSVRNRVFTLAGPAYRLIWLLTRDRFAPQNRKAMRHV